VQELAEIGDLVIGKEPDLFKRVNALFFNNSLGSGVNQSNTDKSSANGSGFHGGK
jgi:hypothetical protein